MTRSSTGDVLSEMDVAFGGDELMGWVDVVTSFE